MYLSRVLVVVYALVVINVAAGGVRTAPKAISTGMFLIGQFKGGAQFQMNVYWAADATSKVPIRSIGLHGEYWYLHVTSSYTLELRGTLLPDGHFHLTETEA